MQKSVAPKKIKALRRIRLSVFFSVLQSFAHPAYAIFPQDPSFLLRLLRAGAWPLPPGQITAKQKILHQKIVAPLSRESESDIEKLIS
jgi:hypothetical protein